MMHGKKNIKLKKYVVKFPGEMAPLGLEGGIRLVGCIMYTLILYICYLIVYSTACYDIRLKLWANGQDFQNPNPSITMHHY